MTVHLVRRIGCSLAAALVVAAALSACSDSSPKGSGKTRAAASDTRIANVTITAQSGCRLDRSDFAAGGITFKIANRDATAVSEVELLDGQRILGEKENVAAGLSGQFAVKVGAGTYTLYCPGAATERSTITVTGTAAKVSDTLAGLLKTGTEGYRSYVNTQIGYLVSAMRKLANTLHGSDLKAAQDAYIAARPFYEKVEPVAESFVNGTQNLDADIDARANDVPASSWSGFHRLEKGLFETHSLAGLITWGDRLVADVLSLQRKAKSLRYQAPDLANGAQGLLDEVAAGKITGEEERYSHIDMVDMANNVEGSEQAFAQLEPALTRIDAILAAAIAAKFTALDKVIDTYRTTSNASGYVLYSTLTDADRRSLAAAVKAVQEPLSRVAGKVANA